MLAPQQMVAQCKVTTLRLEADISSLNMTIDFRGDESGTADSPANRFHYLECARRIPTLIYTLITVTSILAPLPKLPSIPQKQERRERE